MAKTDATADAAGRVGPGGATLSGATLSEVFPEPGAEAAAAGFVRTRLQDRQGPVLWVQDRMARLETGRPTLAALDGRPLLHLCLSRAVDVMVAVEEGLRCPDLSAVIAEVRGEASAISFTALKRIALRSEAAGVPCWLIRQAARADLSAARNRWRIATLPSAPHPDAPRAPVRGGGRALLADPTGGAGRPERGTQPLADRDAALCPPSRRPARTGRSALAARPLPGARRASRRLDRAP